MYGKNEKGQALPLGIAFLMSASLMAIVLFNTGQSASEKSRLVNAADAAVYSGLVWQARALNFQAYTNRAMVANQVSVGQLVSLTSWTKYAYTAARNINNIGQVFPIVREWTDAAETVSEAIDDIMVAAAETVIPIVDSVNGILSRTQQAVFVASFAATPGIVSEVVERNDQRYNASTAYAVMGMGENATGWQNIARRYDDRDGLLRKANVVNRSKDEFTASRNLNTGDIFGGSDRVYMGARRRFWIRKQGRTNLVIESSTTDDSVEFEWKGKDSISQHSESLDADGWGNHIELPVGWGSRYVNGDFECQGSYGCPRYMPSNRRAERNANRDKEALNAQYNGIRAYYGLRDLSRENKDPRLALRIEVELPQGDVRTASKIDGLGSDAVPQDELRTGIGQGMFGTQDRMAGGGMSAIASGELYFHPPDDYIQARRSGRYEIANLFSPYWEVHLIDTPMERRFMAWALRDETLLTDGASGVAEGVAHFVSDRAEELEQLRQLQARLQSELDNTQDGALRSQLEIQLADVSSQMTQLESEGYNANGVSDHLEQEMAQGLASAEDVRAADYGGMLQEYVEQDGENLV
jgi:hypothetical protein